MTDFEDNLSIIKNFLVENKRDNWKKGFVKIYANKEVTSLGIKAGYIDAQNTEHIIEEGIPGFMMLMSIKKLKKYTDETNPVKWNILEYELDFEGCTHHHIYWDQQEEDTRNPAVRDDDESRLDHESKSVLAKDSIKFVLNNDQETWYTLQRPFQDLKSVFQSLYDRGHEIELVDLKRINFESKDMKDFGDMFQTLADKYDDFRFSLFDALWDENKREYYAYVFDLYYDSDMTRVSLQV